MVVQKRLGWSWVLVMVIMMTMPMLSLAFEETTTATAAGEEAGAEASSGPTAVEEDGASPTAAIKDGGDTTTTTKPNKQQKDADDGFNARDHTDWGSYYDPQNVFCGKFDCYQILGFDYESYGREKPTTRVITKRYRALSREWHPDKNKRSDAKERFVKIARAYEVLTNMETRKEYDMMRYDQEAYFQKYGASVLWQYAPQSDASFIILFLLIAANVFTWYAQKTRWQNVADRLIKAAVEDWTPSMGGTTESKQLREQGLAILKKREEEKEAAESNNNNKKSLETQASNLSTKSGGKNSKKSKGSGGAKDKLSAKEKKQLEQEQLRPIVTELVNEMHDFGAGFHKPTWKDLFIVKLGKFPMVFGAGLVWQSKYWFRRLQGKELNDEERYVLTERAVGHVTWELSAEEDRAAMVERELWKLDNLVEWKEEQEVKNMSKADQKYYAKMKKRGFKEE